jgi:hypothetical protein
VIDRKTLKPVASWPLARATVRPASLPTNRHATLATVKTASGGKTIAVEPATHTACLLALEYAPAPADAPAATSGRLSARGQVVDAQLFTVTH